MDHTPMIEEKTETVELRSMQAGQLFRLVTSPGVVCVVATGLAEMERYGVPVVTIADSNQFNSKDAYSMHGTVIWRSPDLKVHRIAWKEAPRFKVI